MITIKGKLSYIESEGVYISRLTNHNKLNYPQLLHEEISNELQNEYKLDLTVYDEDMVLVFNYKLPNVQISFNYCKDLLNDEELLDSQIKLECGMLECEQDWFGYSAYTICAFYAEHFKLGGHDLEEIFKTYVGYYVTIYIEVLDR